MSHEANLSKMGRAALWWAERFRSPVLPLWPAVNGVCACPRAMACQQHPGKHPIAPLAPRGSHSATRADWKIIDWWRRYPDASIGLAAGHPLAGGGYLIVVDVDPRNDGDHSLEELEVEHGPLPRTLTIRTGGGGWHYYLRTSERPARSPDLAPGVEIKGPGGYVVAPPSTHASGKIYTIETLVRPAPAPDWVVEALRPKPAPARPATELTIPRGEIGPRYVEVAIEQECAAVASAPEGTRNDTLNRAAFSLARFVAEGRADAVGVIRALTIAAVFSGLDEHEIGKTIGSAFGAREVAL